MLEPLYKHQDFWVVYKPPGISFHSDAGGPGFFEQARQAAAQEGIGEIFPVHRLDKVTSGILLLATNAESNRELCKAFSQHKVQKYYLAISDRKPLKKQGAIIGDMEASRNGTWKLTLSRENPAVTQFFSCSIKPGLRLFILKPHTGKTHQLRVAMKSLGAAIAGDNLYAGQIATTYDRCYLHAYSLGFELAGHFYRFTEFPREGEMFMQAEFQASVAQYKEPWLLGWSKK